MEKVTNNGSTGSNGPDNSRRDNNATGRRLNKSAVDKLRNSAIDRADKSVSAELIAGNNGRNVGSAESRTSSGSDVKVNRENRQLFGESGSETRPIDKSVNDGRSTNGGIEFHSGRETEQRKPRAIEWGDEEEFSTVLPEVKKPATRRKSSTQAVDTDTASIVIQLCFGLLVVTLGEHWKQSDENIISAAEPLARILSKLPKAKTAFLNTYLDPILFIYAMVCMTAKPLSYELQRMKRTTNPAKVNQNVVTANTQVRAENNGAEIKSDGESSINDAFFRGFNTN